MVPVKPNTGTRRLPGMRRYESVEFADHRLFVAGPDLAEGVEVVDRL
jgi:hypothetical protein